jgi:hypothetical protein
LQEFFVIFSFSIIYLLLKIVLNCLERIFTFLENTSQNNDINILYILETITNVILKAEMSDDIFLEERKGREVRE